MNARGTVYIIRNSGKCKFCGQEVVSNFKGDMKYHSCRRYVYFVIRGGDVSLRREFFPDKTLSGFIDTSLVRSRLQDNLTVDQCPRLHWEY